jgi:membrane fusion protein, heavy metal efflux system
MTSLRFRMQWTFIAFAVMGMAVTLSGCSKAQAESDATSEGEGSEEGEGEKRDEVKDTVALTKEAMAGAKLTFAKAEQRKISPSLEIPAEIVPIPDRWATLGPRVAGRVVEIPVNVGDEVKKGQTVVLLESHEVGRTRADLIAASARLEVAKKAAERQRKLLEENVTSQRAVEEADGARRVAQADLSAASTRLRTFGVGASSRSVSTPAGVALTSPLSGTVVSREAHMGQWAEPADTLVQIVNLDELWVEGTVYEREMRFVAPGKPALVEVRAFPGQVFEGKVDRVDPTLDSGSRSVRVRVTLANSEHRLKPGMFATVRIKGVHEHEPRELLAIPWAAVQEVDSHPSVFVRVGEGRFEVRRVHLGDRAGEDVEIANGLAAGDEVVAEGSFLLKSQLLRSTLGEDE